MALTEDNRLLLKQTMHKIEMEPETWDQHIWGMPTPCGTVACFAGHALMLHDPSAEARVGSADASGIPEDAARLLGLSEAQADLLFHPVNSLVMLQAGVQAILDADGEIDRATLMDRMIGPRG